MTDTLLIWFNPDSQKYETGFHSDYQLATAISSNQDRFEVLHEFSLETSFIANKILRSLNVVRTTSSNLNR